MNFLLFSYHRHFRSGIAVQIILSATTFFVKQKLSKIFDSNKVKFLLISDV